MDNKKMTILTVIVVILAFTTMGAIILSSNLQNNEPSNNNPSGNNPSNPSVPPTPSNTSYMVIDNTDLLEYQGSIFRRKEEITDLDGLFNIYIDKEYFGKYNLRHGNTWMLFNNNKYVNYTGNLLAVSENLNVNIKNKNITKINEEDLEEISTILNKEIDVSSLEVNEKMILDLDGNGIEDKLVCISNVSLELLDSYVNLAYVVLNGNIQVLVKENIKVEDVLISPSYSINYVINVNSEMSDSILLRTIYFSNSGVAHNVVFQYRNNKYVEYVD